MSTTSQPRGIGFSLLFPPGWREFRPDVDSEKTLTDLATRSAKEAGRLDVVMVIRQHVHRMFEGLRRRGAVSVYLPVEVVGDRALPASLTVVPVRVPPGQTLESVVGSRAGDSSPVQLPVDDTTWYQWTEREQELDGSREVGSTTIHYVVPRPGDGEPQAALHLIYAFTVLTDDDGDYAQSLESLGHGVIGTFMWGARE